jgi:hypothetical protein
MTKVEWQLQAYGCTEGELLAAIPDRLQSDAGSLQMFAMGILSDAQEEIARGNADRGRQFINRAKRVMSMVGDILRETN